MSFFATKLARKGPQSRRGAFSAAPKGGVAGKMQAAALQRIGCAACPLNKADVVTPKMLPTLVKGGKIYFMAEAPGRDEDENTGRPLTGPSGSLLRECIPDEWEAECSFDNVVNCRPPGNRTPVWNEMECLPGGTLTAPIGAAIGGYRRRFKGQMLSFGTVRGNSFSCTPNHPVFALRGRLPAGGIKVGDYLINCSFGKGVSFGNPNIHNKPTCISDVFSALLKQSKMDRVDGSPLNFHGDGTFGKVDIVRADGNLLTELKPPFQKHFLKGDLTDAYSALCSAVSDGSLNHNLAIPAMITALASFISGTICIPNEIGFRSAAELDAIFNEIISNKAPVLMKHLSELLNACSISIKLDQISAIDRTEFDGHVYNLETTSGVYLANGFVVGNCCRPRRDKFVQEAKPLLIVGLGAVPLQAVLGSHDLAGMRGRMFAVKFGGHACWFMPTYHPSFILRIAKNKRKPLNSMMGHCFRMDLKRAFEYVEWLEPPVILTEKEIRANVLCFDGSQPSHEASVLQLLAQAAEAKEKTVDLETKGLRPYKSDAVIMSAAFSFDSVHFAFALDHPKAGWSEAQKGRIKKAFKEALLTGTKIAHNSPFEIEWLLWYLDCDILQHHQWHCTQMECHFLDERRGKSKSTEESDRRAAYQALDFLIKQHFGCSYKSFFKLNKKDMSKSDLGETLVYNGADTKVTQMLHKRQMMLLKKLGLWEAYLEARPRQASAAMMQFLGVHVDQAEVTKAQNKLKPEIEKLETDIAGLKVVKAYVSDHGEFNPLSTDHAIEIFKDYLHRPEVEIKPERHEAHDFNKSSASKKRYDDGTGSKYSVDKNVLDQIDHPLARMIINLRNRTKLKSTYVDDFELGKGELVYPDGFLHPNFNTTFAETGRLSSDGPNAQNFPKRNDEWVRQQIAAPDGYVLVAFDFGQLEACTAAMCSKDKVLVKALWEDYDIHMEWAERTAHRYPAAIGGKVNLTDKKVMKDFRSRIKNKLVFPAIFGAQNSSIAGYLDMPEDVIDDLMRDFWKSLHGLADWQDKLMKRYYADGYVESPTGRRRHYPMTRNQAINDPIQSVACDIVCKGMNTLSELAAEEQQWHLHPILNIHDDLTMCMPDDDKILEQAITDVYSIMLTPGYDFINVPLSVTGSIGKRWYGMTEIGKFWSHKDL